MAIVDDIAALADLDLGLNGEQHSQQQWSLLGHIGAATVGLDGRWQAIDAACCRFLGYRPDQLIGQPSAAITHPEDVAQEQQRVAQLLAGGGLSFTQDKRLRHSDGSLVPVFVATTLVRDALGQPVCLVSHLSDSTASSRLRDGLASSQRLEGLGRLVGSVAHDFNNILMSISGYAEILALELDEEDIGHRFATEIHRAACSASSLSRQLLNCSQPSNGETELVAPLQVIETMADMLRRLLGHNMDLQLDLATDTGCIYMPRGSLEQVLMNLAINARDAMNSRGQLTVTSENVQIAAATDDLPAGYYVLVRVRDTGVGMDAATQARIFEPFFTTKGETGGTGLGLCNVAEIVAKNSGAIRIDSRLGEGTTFEIYLPCAQQRVVELSAENALSAPSANGAGLVLLVEDETSVRGIVQRLLERSGFHVLEACNGVEALEILRCCRGGVALVLTDVMMPVMGGHELAKEIEAMWPDIKVLYMSGHSDEAWLDETGINVNGNLLRKPFSGRDLAEKLGGLLAG